MHPPVLCRRTTTGSSCREPPASFRRSCRASCSTERRQTRPCTSPPPALTVAPHQPSVSFTGADLGWKARCVGCLDRSTFPRPSLASVGLTPFWDEFFHGAVGAPCAAGGRDQVYDTNSATLAT